jgi:hypothetical protein
MENAATGYSELAAYLGAKKSERPWGNNTRVRQDAHAIVVTLHNTEVAHVRPDGSITLNTGGWQTVTTKDRLNKVLALAGGHWRVWTEKSLWMLYYYANPGVGSTDPIPSYAFADGVTVWPDGRIEGQAPEPPTKLRKAAKAYVNKLVAALLDGSLPAPDNGDCFFCRGIFGDSGERDSDHILNHIEEGYLVPSLLANVISDNTTAIGAWPRQAALAMLWHQFPKRFPSNNDVIARQVKHAVWVYIATRIGLPT